MGKIWIPRIREKPLSISELRDDTYGHIQHVSQGISLFESLLKQARSLHDHTKFDQMPAFYNALISGNIKDSDWFEQHAKNERHHILKTPPNDINLVDVIEYIVDCVVAGLARTGEVYPVSIPSELLIEAFVNTCDVVSSACIVDKKGGSYDE